MTQHPRRNAFALPRAFLRGPGATIFLTVMVGVTPVYLGVHYPTDVLAGWCVGAGWAAICWTVFHWLQQRGAVEPAANDALNAGDRANGP